MKHLIAVLWLAGAPIANAQSSSVDTTSASGLIHKTVKLAESALDLITFERGRFTLATYPLLGYSDRTGVEFGIMPVLRIYPNHSADSTFYRPSTLSPSFQFSTKGMYEIDLDAVFFTKRKWYMIAKAQFLYLPDTFYGLGNGKKTSPYATYDFYKYGVTGNFLRGITTKLFAGIHADINYNFFRNIQNPLPGEGTPFDSTIPGYEGGWCNGVGPVLIFDTRNNIVYPSKGWFVVAAAIGYGPWVGSHYRFGSANVDARHFISLHQDKSILALQGYFNTTFGDEVPFYKLSAAGGKRLLRGVGHPYKYLSNHSWMLQAEFRQHIWWRIGATAFTGIGNVFGQFDHSAFDQVHAMAGAGFRFRILPNETLNFRCDFGLTNRGDRALFFTIREAF